jgi:hypothetical protein
MTVVLTIAVASNIRQMKTGVPQGSVPCPIMFNTFIDNIPFEYTEQEPGYLSLYNDEIWAGLGFDF